MKKLTASVFIWLIILVLILKAVSTFSLCGGTLIQNWLGVGVCTYSQSEFMGLGNMYFRGSELFGAVMLLIFLLVGGVIWLIWRRQRAG